MTFVAQCATFVSFTVQLWMGTIGHHHAMCCFAFDHEDTPPPNRPAYVWVHGLCGVRHFHNRRWLVTEYFPPTTLLLGQRRDPTTLNPVGDTCTLEVQGPAASALLGYTPVPPVPPEINGTYQCPTKRGMQMGTFTLKQKVTK